MLLKPILNKTLAILILLSAMAGCKNTSAPKMLLPIFGEKKLSNNDTVYHTINDFSFKN